MLLTTLLILTVSITKVGSNVTHRFIVYESYSILGTALRNVEDVNVLQCGRLCSHSETCDAANYQPDRRACTLMDVEDVIDDWKEDDSNVTLLCKQCNIGGERQGKNVYLSVCVCMCVYAFVCLPDVCQCVSLLVGLSLCLSASYSHSLSILKIK